MARDRTSGGGRLLLLLVLLGLLGGAGTWNYRRNMAAEQAEYRPYRSYSSEDLASLRAAYEQEIEAYGRRYAAATGRSVEVAGGRQLADQIQEFERVQRISQATRSLGSQLSQRQADVRRIAEEQQRRVGESDRLMFHLRRLVTVRAL